MIEYEETQNFEINITIFNAQRMTLKNNFFTLDFKSRF